MLCADKHRIRHQTSRPPPPPWRFATALCMFLYESTFYQAQERAPTSEIHSKAAEEGWFIFREITFIDDRFRPKARTVSITWERTQLYFACRQAIAALGSMFQQAGASACTLVPGGRVRLFGAGIAWHGGLSGACFFIDGETKMGLHFYWDVT